MGRAPLTFCLLSLFVLGTSTLPDGWESQSATPQPLANPLVAFLQPIVSLIQTPFALAFIAPGCPRASTNEKSGTVTISQREGEQPTHSIVILHGLAAPRITVLDAACRWAEAMPTVRFVLPKARPQTLSLVRMENVPVWYDVRALDPNDGESCDGAIDKSREQIESILHRESAIVGGASRVALVGYSQGGALAIYTGLRRTIPLGAVVAISGYLPCRWNWKVEPASRSVPFRYVIGNADPVVRSEWAKLSQDLLVKQGVLGAKVQWYPFVTHTPSLSMLSDVGIWLAATLRIP